MSGIEARSRTGDCSKFCDQFRARHGWGAVLVVAFVIANQNLVWFAGNSSGSKKDATIGIRSSDLAGRVVVTGELKEPLGTLVTVAGDWRLMPQNEREQSLYLVITHINGVKQGQPIIFRREAVMHCDFFLAKELQFAEGEHWELRVFERGEFVGCPEGAFREIARARMGSSYNELDVPYPSGMCKFEYEKELQYISGRKVTVLDQQNLITGQAEKRIPQNEEISRSR
jgi:hypothetical protein